MPPSPRLASLSGAHVQQEVGRALGDVWMGEPPGLGSHGVPQCEALTVWALGPGSRFWNPQRGLGSEGVF